MTALPVFSLVFIAYAYYGGYLPYTWSLAHQGFNFDAIIAQFTMGTAGFYGTPLGVAASYIVLFTIYGAVLDYSGAGKFFIDLSFAAFKRSPVEPDPLRLWRRHAHLGLESGLAVTS